MNRVVNTPLEVARSMKPGEKRLVVFDRDFDINCFSVRLSNYNAKARKDNIFIHHAYKNRLGKMVFVACTADERDQEIINPAMKDEWRKRIPKEWKQELGIR